MNDQTALLMFLGRLHPLILHLPIGLWIAIVVMEYGGALVRRAPGRATLTILAWIAALGGAFAAGSGWLLANEDYSGRTVDLHRWLGVSAAGVGLVAASFAAMQSRGPFRLMLIVEIVLVMAASHLGSELTRGDQWLFEPFQKKSPALPSTSLVEHGTGVPANPVVSTDPAAQEPVASAPTFATAIAPLLTTYCTQCHGDTKQKGELALNSQAAILLGGENGPVLRSGHPDDSPLYAQLLLPPDDDLHMPPENKKQPKPEDIAVIGAWIAAGAPFDGAFDPVWTEKPLA
ncbi:MAG: c-type cytochrome domain-containing protein, partial [Planctomycetota bacterium]